MVQKSNWVHMLPSMHSYSLGTVARHTWALVRGGRGGTREGEGDLTCCLTHLGTTKFPVNVVIADCDVAHLPPLRAWTGHGYEWGTCYQTDNIQWNGLFGKGTLFATPLGLADLRVIQ